ncbi:MAG TPA: aconitate hydratase AcnA [Ktedonobacterales bacterium]|nr:aconitate hydratase AcnA [Ktedonobacterales bacterium]
MRMTHLLRNEYNAVPVLWGPHDGAGAGAGSPQPQHGAFGARQSLATAAGPVTYYRLATLADQGIADLTRLPFTVKIFLENLLRLAGGPHATEEDVNTLARWNPARPADHTFAFLPARVILQDFTGVPVVVDLATMRTAVAKLGGDPSKINPLVPVDLVIDHSVQVDRFGSSLAFSFNVEQEYQRNGERYALLRWAQQAFQNFSVVPPGTGIVHQVNLEYLAKVVQTRQDGSDTVALPDTLVGTDSHTTMINGLGVLGWGVGGIEAEAVLLGQPIEMVTPTVVGFRFTNGLPEGATATDLVLTVAEILRKHGVVNKFVEFAGPGLSQLSLADRATLSNMAPEYGATSAFFPVDEETLRYLRLTGRESMVDLVERYSKEQGLFRTDDTPDPQFNELIELDLSTVEPSLAGPRRPQDRVALPRVRDSFRSVFPPPAAAIQRNGTEGEVAVAEAPAAVEVSLDSERVPLRNGSVVIAAITSCTNTSNPTVMVGAGLLAKHAVERGLRVRSSVKTSLAPGSKVVTDYLERAGLMPYLEALGFHLVGYGCTTCIGNSGPLLEPISAAIQENNLAVVSVLSGNRNFEGRIHPDVRASYLASPPLVVAYALAGTVETDLAHEPVGEDHNGQPVYLREIWPSSVEIRDTIAASLSPEMFRHEYAQVFDGDERWRALPVPEGSLYEWDPNSTYVQMPPFFEGMTPEPAPLGDITGARVLAVLGDSVTTDHISPAGSIAKDSPAGKYLIAHGVEQRDFNSYGSRRGNHEVMMRGTFANIRLRNQLASKEGNWTAHQPDGEVMTIYDAAMRYQQEGTPLVILAGREYGSGSSRDWAGKGPMLLGIKVVIAESYERIHRSNLIGMGVLPLQFQPGENASSLGLSGHETYEVTGVAEGLAPGKTLSVRAVRSDGSEVSFSALARLDTQVEIDYYRNGGILPAVLRQLMK